jgi:hypothetical protein
VGVTKCDVSQHNKTHWEQDETSLLALGELFVIIANNNFRPDQ